ncbi:hypothetical protein LEN26_006708 [Aphanomyces euteiches]|nr:hypothetical protein LEN26_006708 [Aphanomyces euteiches]
MSDASVVHGCVAMMMDDIPPPLDFFLPDIDESLFDEASSFEAPAGKVPVPPRNRSNKILVDLAMLHNEAYDLTCLLENLKNERKNRAKEMPRGKWAQVARNQLTLKLRAMRENEELKTMLKDQTAWRQQLEYLLLRKPRATMNRMTDERWRMLHLSSIHDERVEAIHAIANRQFDQMESDMVVACLLDATDEIDEFRSQVMPTQLHGEAIRFTTLDGPQYAVAEALWSTIQNIGRRPQTAKLSYKCEVEAIDINTLYLRQRVGTVDGAFRLEAGVVIKRFVVNQKTCIVWRTVLVDDAKPFSSNSSISNFYGWIEVEPTSGNSQTTSYKAFCNVQVNDLTHSEHLGLVLQRMSGVSNDAKVDSLTILKESFVRGFGLFERDARASLKRLAVQSPMAWQAMSPPLVACEA